MVYGAFSRYSGLKIIGFLKAKTLSIRLDATEVTPRAEVDFCAMLTNKEHGSQPTRQRSQPEERVKAYAASLKKKLFDIMMDTLLAVEMYEKVPFNKNKRELLVGSPPCP